MGEQPQTKQISDVAQPSPHTLHRTSTNLFGDASRGSFFVSELPDQRGKSVLEISCGLNPYPLDAKLSGSEHYVKMNRTGSENSSGNTVQGVLNHRNSPVDSIIFNATFAEANKTAPEHSLAALCRALDKNLAELRECLKASGRIFLCFSTNLALDSLHTRIIENKLFLTRAAQSVRRGATHYLYELKPIIFKNAVQEFIYDDDYLWFKKYLSSIQGNKVLKVGYGLGFASYFMRLANADVTSLDVVLNADALSDDVVLYEGSSIPFPDNSFDTVVCTYTLHHTPSPEALFKELCRVSKTNVAVIEETYTNFLQKLDVVYTCWRTNRRGGQKVEIQWGSYLSDKRFARLFSDQGLRLQKREQGPRQSFLVDLIIGSK